MAKLSNYKNLDDACRRITAGMEAGVDEDTLVALELGAEDPAMLSDLQKQVQAADSCGQEQQLGCCAFCH